MRAATIAEERAHAHSGSRCWQYVKEALLAAGAVNSYPKTAYAKQAGDELVNSYGFKKLAVRDPYQAPVGSVIVYGASKAAGHVEIRTRDGFVSDFRSNIPSRRPLLGVYAKASSTPQEFFERPLPDQLARLFWLICGGREAHSFARFHQTESRSRTRERSPRSWRARRVRSPPGSWGR